MDAVTHLLVGRALAQALGPATPLGVLAQVFAVLPDADTVTWLVPRLRRYLHHRGATHSLLFGAAASLAMGALFALAGWSGFLAATAVAFGAFLTHVLLDVLHWGCALMWPLRPGRVEHTVHAGMKASAVLSALGLAALVAFPSAWLAATLGGTLVAYFAARIALRAWAERRHGARVFPTGNPLVWVVAE